MDTTPESASGPAACRPAELGTGLMALTMLLVPGIDAIAPQGPIQSIRLPCHYLTKDRKAIRFVRRIAPTSGGDQPGSGVVPSAAARGDGEAKPDGYLHGGVFRPPNRA